MLCATLARIRRPAPGRLNLGVRAQEQVMRKLWVTASISLLIASCGGKSSAPPATAPPTAESAATTLTASVTAIVYVQKVAGKSQAEVAALLGAPTSCEVIKQGKKCSYAPGETDVVFISGKADWITIEGLDLAPYSDAALPFLGVERTAPAFANENVMRWGTIPGLLEVSIFPAQTGVDYAYIKSSTP